MAGHIPKTFISNLLERLDIVDVINTRVELKKKGSNYMCCCPFHNEKSPSFSVSHSKQFYHCFGCGVSGDAIKFLQEFDRLSFVEAVEQLAKTLGLTVPYEGGQKPQPLVQKKGATELLDKLATFYKHQLHNHQKAQKYLASRGFSKNTLERYDIGFVPEGWQHAEAALGNQPQNRALLIEAGMLIEKSGGYPYDRFRNRIMFPIRNRSGQVIGFGGRSIDDQTPKYLNSPETYLFHKGSELYGLFEAQKAIRDSAQMIIVEGYADVLALAEHDILTGVATLGTAATSEHIKLLIRHAKTLIFCFDGDTAGKRAAWRALENALPFANDAIDIKFAFLPEGEDPDSFLQTHGKPHFLQFLSKALNLSDYFIQYLSQNCDLSTIEGKNRLSQSAKPLLTKLPAGLFRDLMAKKLAKILNIDARTFMTTQGLNEEKRVSKPTNPMAEIQLTSMSPMRTAISLLLQHPELASKVDNLTVLKAIKMPGMDLLTALIETIQLHPNIHTAALLQTFSDHPQKEALKKLALRELFQVENGHIQEFVDILSRFSESRLEYEINQLLTKANISGLSEEERLKLQNLIANSKT